MKKLINLTLAAAMVLTLASCGSTTTESNTENQTVVENTSDVAEEKPETITIKSFNGNKEEIDLEVAYDPERIVILDMSAFDILGNIGMGDRVVGTASTSIDYLQEYITDDVANVGTIKEANLEAIMAVEPDVIFIGGRLTSSYDALSEIAPVVYLAIDTEEGVVASTEKNATTIASLFGLEDMVAEMVVDFNARIETLQEVAEGSTALIGMTTSGSFNLLGNDGRCSIIGKEIGFDNLAVVDGETSSHGEESSFEIVIQKDPDYIFVMDRDAAIGSEGAATSKEIIENELVMQSSAYQNDQIVYLEHSNIWYVGEGGISALDIMLQDLENGLLK